jgi:hypothetical protein
VGAAASGAGGAIAGGRAGAVGAVGSGWKVIGDVVVGR